MARRARYLLIGGVALAIAVGLVGWQFWGGRGEALKPDGGPVVTVMDFRGGFPVEPLPSGWRHRKFWTRSPMTMASAVKDGVPSMRFETRDSASMLFRQLDIDLAACPRLGCLSPARSCAVSEMALHTLAEKGSVVVPCLPAKVGTHLRSGHRPEPVLRPAEGRTRGPV